MVFGSLPFILRNAYIGVLVWSWLSYMNPHRLTWGFAYDMPFAQIVAIVLLVSLMLDKEKKEFHFNALTKIWICLLVWMMVSTVFSLYFDSAFEQLIKIYKIQAVTLLTILLINNQKKIDWLLWVIVVSIGFYSVKGGVFTLLNGGDSRVYGPRGFIEENNSLAVATLMIVPLMFYLRKIVNNIWYKRGIVVAALLSMVSVLGSQSRGALIAIVTVGFFFWLKTKGKLVSGIAIIVLALLGFNFMPETWHARMDTIQNYQEDSSAMGRINAWEYAVNVANHRLAGAGLQSWKPGAFAIYAPIPEDVHAAHSIYFSVLADHGWPGMIMFLLILYLGWRYLSQVIRYTRDKPEYDSQNLLARMLQVSLIAYMSGGAFLSLSYFDLPWHLIAIAVLLRGQILGNNQEQDRTAGNNLISRAQQGKT